METIGNLASIRSSGKEQVPSSGITTQINVGPKERIISALGGAILVAIGLSQKKTTSGIGLAAAGGYLLYRGASGNCPVNSLIGRNNSGLHTQDEGVTIEETMYINKPKAEVYNFWRELSNLPLFMKHLEEVVEEDNLFSRWKAKIPGNLGTISWDAKITKLRSNELIAWNSLPGATVDNGGSVEFKEVGTHATEVKVIIHYRAPAGQLGSSIAKLLNPVFSKLIREDIRGFKQYIEKGELINQ